ncbi:hypothetical protein HR45_02755 [Shewanella mangrovi]|uniref:Uncharacterized protein n=1 Tax=Shewanella mangrovi TaxID=1515746 RepID=A0A094JK12_9GAMM|nr:hypothetical protein HR45_02755 [Shewanella mangrovi]
MLTSLLARMLNNGLNLLFKFIALALLVGIVLIASYSRKTNGYFLMVIQLIRIIRNIFIFLLMQKQMITLLNFVNLLIL